MTIYSILDKNVIYIIAEVYTLRQTYKKVCLVSLLTIVLTHICVHMPIRCRLNDQFGKETCLNLVLTQNNSLSGITRQQIGNI